MPLSISTKPEKKNASMIFSRFPKEENFKAHLALLDSSYREPILLHSRSLPTTPLPRGQSQTQDNSESFPSEGNMWAMRAPCGSATAAPRSALFRPTSSSSTTRPSAAAPLLLPSRAARSAPRSAAAAPARRSRCRASAAAAPNSLNVRLTPPGLGKSSPTVVYKFGGSSVADATRMREVADIVCSFPEHLPVIVLSAMGKVR